MLIQVKGKNSNTGRYKTKDLTPIQRVESLAERNYKPSGDRATDRAMEQKIEQTIKDAKDA